MNIQAPFYGVWEPVYPCRDMPTRHCPAVYGSVCGERPCARYDIADEEAPAIWGRKSETTIRGKRQ